MTHKAMRARDIGITIGTLDPGPHNAITDVPGVKVGHATINRGEGALKVGDGPVRTGVTMVVPCDDIWERPVFAATHRLNGNGELTGLEWVRESGTLTTPIGLTNTHSVGAVRDALVSEHVRARPGGALFWSMPVVGETYDGVLNDINGHHVGAEHVAAALASAAGGPVAEGNLGSGTGMICHEFKGGIGTASRRLANEDGGYTIGVLVQANHGRRERLTVNGLAVGRLLTTDEVPAPDPPELHSPGAGSIIVLMATDAPLLPHQCARLAQRAGLGVARTGGVGENNSGDLFLAFATGNTGLHGEALGQATPLTLDLNMVPNERMTPMFDAVVEATEEAIVNTLVAAETLTGRDGVTAHALPRERLAELIGQHGFAANA
jgi:D-aminopeptidase